MSKFGDIFSRYESVKPPQFKTREIEEYPPQDFFTLPEEDYLEYSPFLISEEETKEKPKETPQEEEDVVSYSIIDNIINTGRQLLGNPYLYGGTDPNNGIDCSAFVQYIYKQNGYNIGRDSASQLHNGTEVKNLTDIRPGDIIITQTRPTTETNSGRHVQLATGTYNPQTGMVQVIEARGRKYGIVERQVKLNPNHIKSIRRIVTEPSSDPFLQNQQIRSPYPKGKFTDENDFARTLITSYKQALTQKGIDPNYAYILTALDSMESGYGKHVSADFNYGGIKTSNDSIARYAITQDYDKGQLVTHSQPFRNFDSVLDFCKYKVDLLSRDRYNAFTSNIGTNSPYTFTMHTLSRGYGSDYGGQHSRNYSRKITQIYNDLINLI